MRKGMFVLFSLLSSFSIFAQSFDEVKSVYDKDKRDVKAVTAYVKALENAKMKRVADSVTREFMYRCPVVQLEDKDTYLLINKYVFEHVYSNAFEHGIYAQRKMRWDREEKEVNEGRKAALLNMLKGLRSGVSDADEIDKRYEVLSVLSNNLHKEVDKRCIPAYEEDRYVMPAYDSVKLTRLKRLLRKGELLGQETMQLKISVYADYVAGNYAGMMQKLRMACDMHFNKMDEDYAVRILNVLADARAEREVLKSGIDLLNEIIAEKGTNVINYYSVLGRLYFAYGDEARGNKYKQMGDAIEAEKMARYGDLIKSFKQDKQ